MKIGVLPNLDKRGAAAAVEKMGKLFKEWGDTAYLPDSMFGTDYILIPEKEIYEKSDIIITVGGDGTIIRYAKLAAKAGKPVLGVNAGRIGFLAQVEPNELNSLKKLKTGEYSVEKRMLLNIDLVENGVTKASYTAMNDAVISSGFISRIIDIKAYLGEECVSYRADGMIISTPTGSTAYSLSAGGPIIDPVTECILVTPICSHTLTAKPIILNRDATLKLKAQSLKKSDIYFSVDGRRAGEIKPYTDIIIKKSPYSVDLIRLDDKSFYKAISEKFKDGGYKNEK